MTKALPHPAAPKHWSTKRMSHIMTRETVQLTQAAILFFQMCFGVIPKVPHSRVFALFLGSDFC